MADPLSGSANMSLHQFNMAHTEGGVPSAAEMNNLPVSILEHNVLRSTRKHLHGLAVAPCPPPKKIFGVFIRAGLKYINLDESTDYNFRFLHNLLLFFYTTYEIMVPMNILSKTNYHFIGIGGIGISAIAKMLLLQDKNVSGSDASSSEITDELQNLGIKINIGQKAENIPENTQVVIYTVAIPENNPEMQEARRRESEAKSNIISYPQFLGELSKNMYTIAISGTHGKTTTTAMTGHILEKAGLDPTIIVGSKMMDENGKYSNFHAGKSKYLVVEACEYKRSFLNLSPTILVITNIEADHLDYYKDLEDIKSAFKEIESKVPKDGFVIKEDEYKNVNSNLELLVPGNHNILNAQAAIKVAEKLGIPNEKAAEYLKDFKGTWRRQEYKGEKEGNIYYDDYAHHPTEIRATLSALKEKHRDRKLVAVFEPHQQSRTRLLLDEFAEALSIADYSFIAPIFITREIDDGVTTNKTLAEKTKNGDTANSTEELKQKISSIQGDLCIVLMGAGGIYKWTGELLS